ncbi:dockerin type I domain-containing protein [Ruminococcus sp.]|uniref:dockerin type I domain-containing protein n=1 Tax=Ruminococcus sp. TaxID=41978 RepID=UPI0025FA6022|nr:dockerin type I domain-containing protein [Ruminococcus sp.]MBQ8966775.1 hypothetical protein [Ruminococcus sp.]
MILKNFLGGLLSAALLFTTAAALPAAADKTSFVEAPYRFKLYAAAFDYNGDYHIITTAKETETNEELIYTMVFDNNKYLEAIEGCDIYKIEVLCFVDGFDENTVYCFRDPEYLLSASTGSDISMQSADTGPCKRQINYPDRWNRCIEILFTNKNAPDLMKSPNFLNNFTVSFYKPLMKTEQLTDSEKEERSMEDNSFHMTFEEPERLHKLSMSLFLVDYRDTPHKLKDLPLTEYRRYIPVKTVVTPAEAAAVCPLDEVKYIAAVLSADKADVSKQVQYRIDAYLLSNGAHFESDITSAVIGGGRSDFLPPEASIFIKSDTSLRELRAGREVEFDILLDKSRTDTYPAPAEPEMTEPGDVNDDGNIDVTDVMLTASYVKGILPDMDHFLPPVADVDHDDDVTVTDLMMIAAQVKGLKPLNKWLTFF